MNSSKLTNALLIVLIAINSLLFVGWISSSVHHKHHRFAMHNQFHGTRHGEFAFRYHHPGSFHGRHGDFKNHGDSHWN